MPLIISIALHGVLGILLAVAPSQNLSKQGESNQTKR